jgi:putative transposase
MSRKGNCWDKTLADAFLFSLKKERIKKCIYRNRALAFDNLSDYTEDFYNRRRRHSHLGGVSLDAYE